MIFYLKICLPSNEIATFRLSQFLKAQREHHIHIQRTYLHRQPSLPHPKTSIVFSNIATENFLKK